MIHASTITPPAWAEGSYSIKQHGVTITQCDAEPIQTPGCIQSHGALIVLRVEDLTILQVSENSLALLGMPPESLLGSPIAVVVGAERAGRLREVIDREPIENNPMYVFTLPSRVDAGQCDTVVHQSQGLAILEFETAGHEQGQSEPDYYRRLKNSVSRLQSANTLADFCQTVTEEVRILTGLDRVMAYRFHADEHGEVFAESKRPDLPSWLGLHYPADDIPKPARTIFTKIWIRPLPNAQAQPVELVPLVNPDTGLPLDMTYCALRGASVMYTEYLHNMDVAASLTMPIQREGRLWGLIACHHYVPTAFPYPMRAACEFLAQVVSLQIKSVEERENLGYRLKIESAHEQLIAAASQEGGLTAMTEGHPHLLDGINADGAALHHRDRWWRIGRTPTDAQLDSLTNWLANRTELGSPDTPVYYTQKLGEDFQEFAGSADIASGLLAVSLTPTHQNLVLWFRSETIMTVNWGGNPHDKPTVLGPHGPRLTPRTSFELFAESVRGQSIPWAAAEIEAASRLRVRIMELVVGRAEQVSELNANLLRSNEELDTFAYVASHDLKEPLRGISKYAHQLLISANLDEENRTRLEGLIRLTLRMDSLLDSLLHFSRLGRTALDLEPVNLNEILEEALEIVSARRAEANSEIVMPRPLPTVHCDRVRVREIFNNLISNALKYNDKPLRRVEIGYVLPGEAVGQDLPEPMPEGTAHQTIFFVRDNGIGIEPRHFKQLFKIFKRLHGR
ncbi:MAG: GAF domain-containing protein, partial [Candidatus Methylumidiphilus sp.]